VCSVAFSACSDSEGKGLATGNRPATNNWVPAPVLCANQPLHRQLRLQRPAKRRCDLTQIEQKGGIAKRTSSNDMLTALCGLALPQKRGHPGGAPPASSPPLARPLHRSAVSGETKENSALLRDRAFDRLQWVRSATANRCCRKCTSATMKKFHVVVESMTMVTNRWLRSVTSLCTCARQHGSTRRSFFLRSLW
jgi:hypothetical protein